MMPACRYLASGTDLAFKFSMAKGERAVEAASKAYLMVRIGLMTICPSALHIETVYCMTLRHDVLDRNPS